MKRHCKMIMAGIPVVLATVMAVVCFPLTTSCAGGQTEKNVAVEKIVAYLKGKNVRMHEERLKAVVSTVYEESQQYDLDYRLALAVIKVESNFQQDVISSKGARGLFQIKPSLAKYIAKDAGVIFNSAQCLHEPDKNIRLGIHHLSQLIDDFKSLSVALHAYNAGSRRAKAAPKDSKEPKTVFTKRVLKEYQKNIELLPESDELEKK